MTGNMDTYSDGDIASFSVAARVVDSNWATAQAMPKLRELVSNSHLLLSVVASLEEDCLQEQKLYPVSIASYFKDCLTLEILW